MRRNAVLFVAISLLSGFAGSAMSLVVSVWILDLTGSSSLAALAGVCVYAPTLGGPWLGGLADRVPRRPLVITVNLVLAAVLLTLFAVRAAGQTWLIFTVSFAYGLSHVLLDAGETALLASALTATDLGNVNGWRASAREGMKLVAPAAGAGLYAWRGAHSVAVLAAAMCVLIAALYAALRLTRKPLGPTPHRQRGLWAGLAVLRAERAVRVPVGLASVSIAMSGFQTAATYSLVTAQLALPATFLGLMGSAQGAGSIISGLVVGRLIAWRGPIAVGATGAVLFGAGCLARCLPWWPMTLATAVVAGIGLPWTLVAAVTAVQTHTPPALLGRVAATAGTAVFGPIALAIPLGSAAIRFGGRPSLVIAAATCLAAAAVAARRPYPVPGHPPERRDHSGLRPHPVPGRPRDLRTPPR